MIDYQRVVDDLQGWLFSASAETVDFLRAATADYMLACDEVNARLRQCGALLKKGLRAEAIQQCEIQPNLLDMVATLDFPDRDQMDDLLRQYGIVPPPPLLLEVAAELNEAYAVQQPLEALLRRHRLLALARSPLNYRLETLRELAQLDADNTVWREDVAAFESERQKQILTEAAAAAKQADAPQLAVLEDELLDSPWQEIPPPAVIRKVSESRHLVACQQARAALERLEPELNAAFAALDLEQARTLRDQWQANQAICGLQQDDPLAERLAPAMDWLAEEDAARELASRHASAARSLEAALDGESASLQKLERLHHAAVRDALQLSPQLARGYQVRVEGLQLAAMRRYRLVLAASIAGLVLIGGLVGAGVVHQLRKSDVARRSEGLQKLLEKGELPAARKYVDQMSVDAPRTAASDEVQQLILELDARERDETRRLERFRTTFSRAVAGGPELADRKLLEESRKLARTADELALLADFDLELAAFDRRRSAERDAEYLGKVREFARRIRELEGDNRPAAGAFDLAIRQLRADIAALEARSGLISEAVRSQVAPLKVRLAVLAKAAELEMRHERESAKITQAVGDPARFEAAIKQYIDAFGDTARAGDFQRVLEEAGLWKSLEAWNHVSERWASVDVTALPIERARELIAATRAVMESHGDFPQVAKLEQGLAYLASVVARRGADGKTIAGELDRLFHDKLVENVWMVENAAGRRFYAPEEPTEAGAAIRFKYFKGFDLTTDDVRLNLDNVASRGPAPQSILAEQVLKELARIDKTSWEGVFYNVIVRLANDADTDPLLKLTLIERICEVASRGSTCLAEALAEFRASIQAAQVDRFVNWIDDPKQEAGRERTKAAAVLAKMPDSAALQERIGAHLKSIRAARYPHYAWVGWLGRDSGEARRWRLHHSEQPGEGELFVVLRPAGGAVQLIRVGTSRGSSIELDVSRPELLLEGRPVYLAEPERLASGS
ncbi:MAG: hypothetical protein WD847_19860 [Pirellulales bacterium]